MKIKFSLNNNLGKMKNRRRRRIGNILTIASNNKFDMLGFKCLTICR
jgi:hypothetical protein